MEMFVSCDTGLVRPVIRLEARSPEKGFVKEPAWRDSLSFAEACSVQMSHIFEFLDLGHAGFLGEKEEIETSS